MDKRNNHNDGVIQLEGHVFKRVKQGLDEEQVLSFANELISQRDNLLNRQSHLSSLIELAERTVAEADNIAQKIRQEAVDKARVDAEEIFTRVSQEAKEKAEQEKARIMSMAEEAVKSIRAKAEEQAAQTKAEAESIIVNTKTEVEGIRANAQSEVEAIRANAQKQAEAIRAGAQDQAEAIRDNAEDQAKAIRADARKQAEIMRREKTNEIKSEIKDLAQRLYGELLSGIENVKLQIEVIETDFERVVSQFGEQAEATVVGSEDNAPLPVDTNADDSPEAIHNISAAILEKMQEDEQADTSELEKKALTMIESLEASDENNLVTLEVLPPVDIHRIMGVISKLEDLPEVRTTELIPVMPKPLITVFLKEPLRLGEVLRTFPEIQQIEEVLSTEETDTTATTTEKKQNRIQITFSDSLRVTHKKEKS